VPSPFGFGLNRGGRGFSSKKTDASATGLPSELRTVPDTVLTGRGSAAEVLRERGTRYGHHNANATNNRSAPKGG